jgi:hypothetical protein
MTFRKACKLAVDNPAKRIITPKTNHLLMVLTGNSDQYKYDCVYPENGRLATIAGSEMESRDWKVFDVETKSEVG